MEAQRAEKWMQLFFVPQWLISNQLRWQTGRSSAKKDDLLLRLEPTHDIAAALGQMKQEDQHIVAFALETNDEETNAEKKRIKKNADFIVLNSTRNPGTTFRTDENQITIISEKGKIEYEKKPKTEVAADIIDELAKLF